MDDAFKTNQRFIDAISKDKGYFGCIYTWGQRSTKYEFIGYELTEDLTPALETMTDDQFMSFKKLLTYFEIHALALKELLIAYQNEKNVGFYYQVAWSHFMTVIMFGILEMATKQKYGKIPSGTKKKKMKEFLENHLPDEIKTKISNSYRIDKIYQYNKEIQSFSDVFDHLWDKVRSGFIHDAGMESRGMEWHQLEGVGTKENPITFKSDVPMQELLRITWQAILNSYGYKGALVLPRYKN
jgi:hypothetical protein